MSEKSDFESASGMASSVHSVTEFSSSRLPATSDGPVTVMQPERSTGSSRNLSAIGGPGSTLLNRLFPSSIDVDNQANGLRLDDITLGHFRIEERIGSGGMGAVFRAVDERLDRVVALKVLSPVQIHERDAVERFRNEARAAARLDHDNIARVHYCGEDQGLYFIAFEYVTGTNLRELINHNGRLEPAEAVNYALQIASALKHTAAAGVIHRDIKPSNIIITPSGRAKLVDLGLARKDYSESANELTVAGTTLGTFDYISPEQARDPRNVDVRSDIYSLGCTLYHMLTGEPPYPDGTFFQRLLDHQDKEPPNPTTLAPRVSPALAAIVQKMMAGKPRLRFSTADDLMRALTLLAGQMGLRGINPEGLVWASSQTESRKFLERHLGWMVSAAALVLIVVALERFPGIGTPETKSNTTNPSNGLAGKSADPNIGPSRIAVGSGKSPKTIVGGNGIGNPKTPDSVGRPVPLAVGPLGQESMTRLIAATGISGAVGLLEIHEDSLLHGSSVGPRNITDGGPKPPTIAKKSPSSKTPPAAAMVTDPVTVQSIVRAEDRAFPTLEAACTWAQDGDVIVLRYNGMRRGLGDLRVIDKPIRIVNKKITIRAGNDFHPQIEFAAREFPEGFQTRMISVSNGSIDVINIDFVVRVDEKVDLDDDGMWSLFSLHSADHVRLEGVNVTFVNPSGKPATLIEFTEKTGPNLAKMKKMMKTGGTQNVPAERFNVELEKCFVRGDCHAFHVASNRPGRIDVKKSAIAIEQTLLNVVGNDSGDMPANNEHIDFKLDHVSCFTGNGLLRMDSGDTPRELLPVHILARNNIIASSTSSALVGMEGNVEPQDFRRKWLRWEGGSNFYDRLDTFWTMTPTQPATGTVSLKFADWKKAWGEATEVGARDDGVAWLLNRSNKPLTKFGLADFRLDPNANPITFPAATAANDGSAVGADLSELRDFQTEAPTQPDSSD